MRTEECTRPIEPMAEPDSTTDWWDEASCNTGTSTLTELFFSDELQDIAAAKRICATCPMIEPCLSGAIERREQLGVWGGQLFRNGRVLASKRQRGRPPKVARPEDSLPEIEIPVSLRASVRYAARSVA